MAKDGTTTDKKDQDPDLTVTPKDNTDSSPENQNKKTESEEPQKSSENASEKCDMDKSKQNQETDQSNNTSKESKDSAKSHEKSSSVDKHGKDDHWRPGPRPKSTTAAKNDQQRGGGETRGRQMDDNQHRMRSKSAGHRLRLTPQEQEIVYEVKANMARKLEQQNSSLESEVAMRKSQQSLQRQHQPQRVYMARAVTGNGLSQHNLKLLMRSYEKKAKDAEERINQLEQQVQDSQDLARRYHKMYLAERDKSNSGGGGSSSGSGEQSGSTSARQNPGDEKNEDKSSQSTEKESPQKENREHEQGKNNRTDKENRNEKDNKCKSAGSQRSNSNQKSQNRSREKVTDDDLEDDKAMYTRHIVKVVEKKAMHMTSPIRVQDVIRKNEVLITENEALTREVQRLKWDNKQLIKQAKESWAQRDQLLHEISTSETARKDLSKRLEKEQKQNQTLGRSLSRQASDWIQFRKELHASDENKRLANIGPISTNQSSSQERSHHHHYHQPKKNPSMARNIPVENWAQSNQPAR